MERSLIMPSFFEVFAGPMFSGKTEELVKIAKRIQYTTSKKCQIFQPIINTRDKGLKSRFSDEVLPAKKIDNVNPKDFYNFVMKTKPDMVMLDELQFFSDNFIDVIKYFNKKMNINVIASGLDTDFKGEPFLKMGDFLSVANEVYHKKGVCDYDCNNDSTLTQRFFEGKPDHYNADVTKIEEGDPRVVYETRCLKHHIVPGKTGILAPTDEELIKYSKLSQKSIDTYAKNGLYYK